jgi:hypothetical protein
MRKLALPACLFSFFAIGGILVSSSRVCCCNGMNHHLGPLHIQSSRPLG